MHQPAALGLFGESATAQAMRAHDWSRHPLGPPLKWPPLLRQTVNFLLSTSESMYLLWGPALHFFSNDAYRPILGPRLDKAIGTTLGELWPDAIEAVRPSVDAAFRGESVRHIDVAVPMARHGEPEETWWTFSFSPVFDDEGLIRGVMCHTVETTQRVLSEQRRDVAEARLKDINDRLEQEVAFRTNERNRIWEVSRDMLLVADDDGIWQSVNPAWTRILGWTQAELVGRGADWIVHPDDAASTREEVRQLADGRATLSFENRLRTRDGDYRRLSWTAVPVDGSLYCVARDVTLERRREQELLDSIRSRRESEARARAYFKTSPEYLLLLGVNAEGDLTVEDMNPSVEHLIQRKRADALGRSPRELFIQGSIDDLERTARECLRTGQNQTYSARRSYEGRPEIVIETVATLVERREDGGGLVFMIARDRTGQTRAEEQLRQAQKMEAVGQLTGGLAHDFNNLLSTISTCLELIRRQTADHDLGQVQRFLATASRSVKGAAALTHRLLAFSRKQSLDLRAIDVNQLCGGLEELLRRTLGERMDLQLRLKQGAWLVKTDANQLENSLLNLAINARDAMPHGGQLTIETDNLHVTTPMPGAPELAPGDYVVISVSDSGTGMPQHVVDRAFDPFFTTKDIGEGTGLGLSMIYGYAKQTGGHVAIFSLEGEGTTVKLFLPRAWPQDREAAAAEGEAEVGHGAGERILVVDDNADLREILVESLQAHGYDAVSAPGSPEALTRLAKEPFDLLVTDVGLPELSGRQLADLARGFLPGLPVLLITGYAKEAAVRGDFVGTGMDMLSKPFPMESLLLKVQELLRRRMPAA